jgi:hypothetical protein
LPTKSALKIKFQIFQVSGEVTVVVVGLQKEKYLDFATQVNIKAAASI